MTYSKGTWNYDAESGIVTTDDRTGDWTKNPIGQTVICSVEPLDGVSNGPLIAAAQKLFEACVAMIEWDAREEDHAVDFHARITLCNAAFQKARAAIALVEGRS